MSASNGVDPYLRAFSRYSGVFQGWRRTTRAHGVGLPSNCSVTSSSLTTCESRPNAPRRDCGGSTTKKYGWNPEYSIVMLFPSRVRPNNWITGSCACSGPFRGSRRYEAVMMRTSKLTISHLRHDLDDVAILDRMVPAHDHFRPGVDGADEVVTQVGVDFKGYVHRGGTTGDEEGVWQDVAALVGPVVLVLHGVHDDEVEELEDRLLDALLNSGRPPFSQERPNFLEPLFLGRGQFFLMQDLEGGTTGLVCDQPGRRRPAKSELVLGGCRDDQVARGFREILERFAGDHIGLVRCEEHGLAAMLQCAREAEEILRCPPGHLRIQGRVPDRSVDLHFREPQASEPGGDDLLRWRFLQIGAPGLFLPVAGENSGNPVRELLFEELHVRRGVVSSGRHRVPLEISTSGCVDHVDECTCLTEVVEEFVAETTALMCLWNETSDIQQFDGDETRARLARRVFRVARPTNLSVWARLAHENHASIRLDCRERIVCDLDGCERRRGEECRLADIRFPYDPQLHMGTNVILPQVPWR